MAATFCSRLAGLLGADGFGLSDGLLIRPSSAIHTLGMTFTIDALALDQHGTIVDMRAGLCPQRIAFFRRRAREVLELPAGRIERAGLWLGDTLSIGRAGGL